MTRVRIYFLNGEAISKDSRGIPVIRLSNTFFRRENEAYDAGTGHLYGLIDTGADDNFIDEEIEIPPDWQLIGTVKVEGATKIMDGRKYLGAIKIVPENIAVETYLVTVPLRKNNRKFDFIIGRSLLRKGLLHMDYRNETFYFEV